MVLALSACSEGAEQSAGRAERGGPADDAPGIIATEDDRGSFSTPCPYSHSGPDDPIVHPGHSGMSHRHDFFGATETDAESDSDSLLASETTCRTLADKTGYWAPSLLVGGRPAPPVEMHAYYRVPVGADATQVEAPPNGLEMIAGDFTSSVAQDPSVVSWRCGFAVDPSPVPLRCPVGMDLRLQLVFAPCWNGDDLGSTDHRSHLARLGSDGACPRSHPVLLPELMLEVRYQLDSMEGELALASGELTGGHGDALMAWDEDFIAREVEICLQGNRSCDVVSESSRLGVDQAAARN